MTDGERWGLKLLFSLSHLGLCTELPLGPGPFLLRLLLLRLRLRLRLLRLLQGEGNLTC